MDPQSSHFSNSYTKTYPNQIMIEQEEDLPK